MSKYPIDKIQQSSFSFGQKTKSSLSSSNRAKLAPTNLQSRFDINPNLINQNSDRYTFGNAEQYQFNLIREEMNAGFQALNERIQKLEDQVQKQNQNMEGFKNEINNKLEDQKNGKNIQLEDNKTNINIKLEDQGSTQNESNCGCSCTIF